MESFELLDKGRKLAAVLALQDDKWRKTFLHLSRDLQEYWLNSLEIAPQRGPDGKKSRPGILMGASGQLLWDDRLFDLCSYLSGSTMQLGLLVPCM